MQEINKIIDNYKNYAVNHWKASCKGDYKAVNSYYVKLTILYKEFLENNEIKELVLPQLMNDSEYSVQLWASCHSLGLGFMKEVAEEKLLYISKLPADQAPSFEAIMTLKEWKEKGSLRF